jgi:hypothetical protein
MFHPGALKLTSIAGSHLELALYDEDHEGGVFTPLASPDRPITL